ncbi:MAG: twin-arginine translocase subunit TatC [Pseudomonadota bacterium]
MADSEKIAHDAAVDSAEMPFMAHLLELRQRILYAVLAVVLLFFPIYGLFGNDLYEWLAAPLLEQLPGGQMIATDVTSPFFAPLKLSLLAALFLGMPFVLHQVWAFIAPGLYLKEKRLAAPLLISSVTLFYLGMAFAYYVVFPLVFAFFAGVAPDDVAWMTDINSYLNFVMKLFLAFGVAFEIPIATSLLMWTGFSTPESLARKRPYVIVGCFVVGMLLTPPDVISQILLALPTWALFELGVFAGRFIKPAEQAEDGATSST